MPIVGLVLNLKQTNLLPLQTGQKVQYWQDKSTGFVTVPFSLALSVFGNSAIISAVTVRGCFGASSA